ncbi:hypothetical protein I6A60_39130 [Frankia sp. AgB1.9]|uniref:hypothetical protein n=1 Tax=unclassified Frankia TaxID=2632575 RepID=UPI0019331CFB|nr:MULTISPECIES: hypothetical protein [unclassified Frankia]MBL7491560.1 hypothetical protein [Frankia sp. AgW1.1]MBL7553799.1 hypothetical protein [Frankia sp. AgB1.9]MBL7617899.1 hypothetical protein [Frankia sp. AgB1.8]
MDLAKLFLGCVRSADRMTQEAREAVARHPKTLELIKAGERLIERQLAGGDPLLRRWLSIRVVAEEYNRHTGEKLTTNAIRDRWKDHDEYVRDVVAWMINQGFEEQYVSAIAAGRDELTTTENLARTIHDVAYRDLITAVENTATKVQFIATVYATEDEKTRDALIRMYRRVDETWAPRYQEIADKQGVQLRPGITAEALAHILTAVAEGLQIRMYGDPACPVVDHDQRTSLLGTAALALFLACGDHFGDGKTLEQLVNGE